MESALWAAKVYAYVFRSTPVLSCLRGRGCNGMLTVRKSHIQTFGAGCADRTAAGNSRPVVMQRWTGHVP